MLVPAVASAKRKTGAEKEAPMSAPQNVVPQTQINLADFGALARAYTAPMGDRRIIVAVNYIRNLSGILEELPSDLSDYVVNAICKIGPQFGAYREYEGPVVPGMFVPPVPAPADRPLASLRISGMLAAAADVEKHDSKRRVDVMGGKGKGEFNGGLSRNRTQTVKSLTVTFTLEGPDHVTIASASYRVLVQKDEGGSSFSFYVAGNGIGLDSAQMRTHSLADAIQDASSAAVINLLGNALLVPYYRCGSIFAVDSNLDKRVRDTLARLTRADLEQNLKTFMIVDGFAMSGGIGLSEHDRAVLELEMRHRNFIPANDQLSMLQFAFSLWKNLDYVNGAKRVEGMLAEIKRQQDEAAIRVASEAALKKQEQANREQEQAAAKQQEQARREQEQAAVKAAVDAAARKQDVLRRERADAARKEAEMAAKLKQQPKPAQAFCRIAGVPATGSSKTAELTLVATVQTRVTAVPKARVVVHGPSRPGQTPQTKLRTRTEPPRTGERAASAKVSGRALTSGHSAAAQLAARVRPTTSKPAKRLALSAFR